MGCLLLWIGWVRSVGGRIGWRVDGSLTDPLQPVVAVVALVVAGGG